MCGDAVGMGLENPGSLEEWGDLPLTKWGYIKPEQIPWIKKTDVFYYVTELLPFLLVGRNVSRFFILKLLMRAFFKPITFFRIKTGFWRGLFELHIFRPLNVFRSK